MAWPPPDYICRQEFAVAISSSATNSKAVPKVAVGTKIPPPGERPLRREFPDCVAHSHEARHHDPAVGSPQAQLSPDRRVAEPEGVVTVARLELCAPPVRGLAELDHNRPAFNPAAARHLCD